MDFVFACVVLGLPFLLAYLLLSREPKGALAARREGESRPWELEEERAERRRVNALLEEEMMRRAA
ncbi:MAG: hypothetical protein AABZ64_06560 [Nitrospinota bacterium]